jgi:hypothetical protein
MHKVQALKFRVVQHKYAAQIATYACALERHARRCAQAPMSASQDDGKIKAKAIAIAGADFARFADHQNLGFKEYESIAAHWQQVDNEGGCSVEGAGIVDVIDMANTMANSSNSVAECQVRSPERIIMMMLINSNLNTRVCCSACSPFQAFVHLNYYYGSASRPCKQS